MFSANFANCNYAMLLHKIFIYSIPSQVLHAFRVFGAQRMDSSGVDDSTIMRSGRWLHDAMRTAYLKFFKVEGIYTVVPLLAPIVHFYWYVPRDISSIPVSLTQLYATFCTWPND